MKKVILFIIAFNFIISINITAQLRTITGLVIYNNERKSNVIIKNISARTQTVSNDRGEFAIPAKTGDTLTASKEDYARDTLLATNQQSIIIQLSKKAPLLKEVTINSTPITAEKTLADNKREYKEIYRIGDKSNIIGPDNIDKIWSAVSKEGNDARRMQRRFNTDYKISIIDRRFNKALVGRITGYKGERLTSFMDKYRPSFEMINKANDYEIIRYIKKKMTEERRDKPSS